ncbi:MAG TPA: ester cyclase [Candidatus Limnocylindrales bacterium]|nr:ester cyclase [Candidatus Limnocylindrales bacterium]
MTTEADNTALVRRFIDEVFVARREDAVEQLLHEDFVGHTWGPEPVGREFLHGAIERVNAGLSDVSMTIEDTVAAGDRVAVRLTSRARQTGELMGMPATGRRYEIGEMHLFRIAHGRITEHWHVADLAAMYRQLGVTPPAPPSGPAAGSGSGA